MWHVARGEVQDVRRGEAQRPTATSKRVSRTINEGGKRAPPRGPRGPRGAAARPGKLAWGLELYP
jgi:hypothetical protein